VKPARSLLEVCIARAAQAAGGSGSIVGELQATPRAMRVAQYVVEWAIALADGCDPEVRAVAAWWKEPEATAYRRNRDFRELFPGEPNPERIARQLSPRRGRRSAARLMAHTIAV
jgi:hypothetical protein